MSRRKQILKKFIEQASKESSLSSDDEQYDSDKDPARTPAGSNRLRASFLGPFVTGPLPYKIKHLTQTATQREPSPLRSQHELRLSTSSDQQEPRPSTSSDQIDETFYDSPDTADDEGDAYIILQQTINNLALEEEQEDIIDDEIALDDGDREIWNKYHGNHKEFDFTGNSGIQKELDPQITPFETFSLIVDNEVTQLVVEETNRYAEQCIQKGDRRFVVKSKNTYGEELLKFLMLIVWMGLVPIGSMKDYWASNSLVYNFDFPKRMMSRDRFQALLASLHFSDNENNQAGDRLAKVRNFITLMQRKFQELFIPGEDIIIDESLVPFRGRLLFPNKAHKYGL